MRYDQDGGEHTARDPVELRELALNGYLRVDDVSSAALSIFAHESHPSHFVGEVNGPLVCYLRLLPSPALDENLPRPSRFLRAPYDASLTVFDASF